MSFYRWHCATPVSLAGLVTIICTRWKIWNSWMRWSLIGLLAAAVLAVTRACTTAPAADIALVPASPRELLAVLRVTALPARRHGLGHVLAWSAWRRHHQHQTAQAHHRWNNVTAQATA